MASLFRRAGRALLALAALSAVHTTDASELPPHARNGRLWAMIQAETQGMFVSPAPATELWFTQRVDHFSSEDRDSAPTFQQRFYEVNTYWDGPDGPVILYIGGEATMDKAPTGFVDTLAKHWGAKILALEHRFYGKSIPNKDISSANYKYLTVQQALADLDYFKREYEAKHLPSKQNKWIAVGGSYPGALSAWFRVAYPNTTVAALSSSGVVLPVYKFTGFDEQVAESVAQECADAMRKATAAFEYEIKRGHSAEVKGLLGAEALADGDFFYMLADAAAMAVQYGHKDVVCSALVNAVKKELSMTEEFAKFVIDMYGKDFGSGCFYDTVCLAKADLKWVDARSWRWQKCSQLAYFQVAPAEGSLRSSIVDLEYHEQQCKAVFGDGLNAKEGTEEVIKLYGGANPKAHNIFFANGGDDPWQRASVLESLSDDEVAVLAKCDLCGHCGDLHALNPNAPEPLKKQQEAILRYLTKWLHDGDAEDTSAAAVATQTETQVTEAKHTQVGYGKEVYRSSPFVLVPIVLAFIVLLAVVHSDSLTDSSSRRRGGYVRLDAA